MMPTALPALADVAGGWAATICRVVQQEYPNAIRHVMRGSDDTPTPSEVHPAFYGCLDWHSAVEMHWALVRLLRLVPDALDAPEAVAVLDRHLTAEALAVETAYLTDNAGFERPYGWGWALLLADELHGWDDHRARRWAVAVRPMADLLSAQTVSWLAKAPRADRSGMHANSAFALARALPWARRRAAGGEPALLDAITSATRTWFAADRDYPAGWEPGASDFLSAAMTEAELVLTALPGTETAGWLEGFLPGLAAGEPASLLHPVEVVDESDGQMAHLHGLNVSRASAQVRLEVALSSDDPHRPVLRDAALRHAAASLPAVSGRDYMVEHWLAAFGVLLLTADNER